MINSNINWLITIVIAFGNISSLFIVIMNIIKLAYSQDVPILRKEALSSLIKSIVFSVILGCSSFFYYAFLYFMAK